MWAPPIEEVTPNHGRRHVYNPHTRRLEPLDLSNALLRNPRGDGGIGAGAEVPHHEEPINVDLLGVVRGVCNGCERCPGYRARPGGAANPNDVDALRCERCGCQAHMHQDLGHQ